MYVKDSLKYEIYKFQLLKRYFYWFQIIFQGTTINRTPWNAVTRIRTGVIAVLHTDPQRKVLTTRLSRPTV